MRAKHRIKHGGTTMPSSPFHGIAICVLKTNLKEMLRNTGAYTQLPKRLWQPQLCSTLFQQSCARPAGANTTAITDGTVRLRIYRTLMAEYHVHHYMTASKLRPAAVKQLMPQRFAHRLPSTTKLAIQHGVCGSSRLADNTSASCMYSASTPLLSSTHWWGFCLWCKSSESGHQPPLLAAVREPWSNVSHSPQRRCLCTM
jgi:hypothetical protein